MPISRLINYMLPPSNNSQSYPPQQPTYELFHDTCDNDDW
jgi:hypothetical protein